MSKEILGLIDFKSIQELLDGFYEITKLSIAVLDFKGNILVKTEWQPICENFHRVHPKSKKNCFISDTVLANKMDVGEQYHFYKCLNGLIDVSVPIVIDKTHIANLYTGQFLFEEADEEFFIKQAEEYGYNKEEYMSALKKVPIVSKDKIRVIMEFLRKLTLQITDLTVEQIKNNELISTLEATRAELYVSNQQLMAGEQQLMAANQQLTASERELRNQLAKSEKQRKATLILLNDLNSSTKKLREEVEQRKKAEDSIRRKREVEKIISEVSESFINIVAIENAINNSLNVIGSFLKVSRAYVFNLSKDKSKLSNTYEWCAEGVLPHKEELQNLPVDTYPWWMYKLNNKKIIEIESIDDMSEEAKVERKFFQQQKIKSLIVLPLLAENETIGFVGFDNTLKTGKWDNDSRYILEVFSRILGNAIKRHQAEDIIKEAHERLKIAVAGGGLGTWEWNLSEGDFKPKGKTIVNDRWLSMLGYKPGELEMELESVHTITDPEMLPRLHELMKAHLEGKTPYYEAVYRMKHKSGHWVWIHDRGEVTERDRDGKPLKVCGTHADISELMQTQEELRISDRQFRRLFENSPYGIILNELERDEKGTPVNFIHRQANHATSIQLGMKLDDLIGTRATEIADEKNATRFIKEYGEVVDTGKPIGFEHYFNHHDKTLWITAFHLNDDYFITTFTDISERIKAEVELQSTYQQLQANEQQLRASNQQLVASEQQLRATNQQLISESEKLKHSEEKYRNLVEDIADVVLEIDENGTLIYISPNFSDVIGYEVQEVIGKAFTEVVYPEDQIHYADGIKDCRKGCKIPIECRIVTKSGEIKWVAILGRLGDDGKIIRGVFRDITDRKKAEEEIKRQKDFFEIVINSAPTRIFWKDLNSVYLGCNTAFAIDAGFEKPEEITGKNDADLIWKADVEKYRQDDREVAESGKMKIGIIEGFYNKEGEKVVWRTSKQPLRDKKGKVIGVIAASENITNMIKASEIIKESEEKLRLIIENSPLGISINDLNGNFVLTNPAYEKMLGYKKEELSEMSFFDITVSEYHENNKVKFQNMTLGRKKGFEIEKKYRKKDGSLIDVMIHANSIHDSEGKVAFGLAMIEDITEKKKIQQKLVESEAKLKNIIENSTNLFYAHSVDNIMTFVSPQIREILGYKPEEAMKYWGDFITDNPVNETGIKFTEEAVRTGKRQPVYELEMLRKDGRKILVEVRESPVLKDGKVVSIVGSLTDITERKAAEQKVKEKMNHLRRLNRAMAGREDRMIELKKEINDLMKKAGEKPPYNLEFLDE